MPVHRAGMMEAPVHRDPARPPGFQAQLVGTNDVARVVEDVEELPGEDFPIAVEERAAEMFGQGFERAAVAGIVGENGRAIELLDGLLGRPSPITVPLLKLSPAWDPLRSDPRFKALLDKYSAKT